jgi:hypothetical protein
MLGYGIAGALSGVPERLTHPLLELTTKLRARCTPTLRRTCGLARVRRPVGIAAEIARVPSAAKFEVVRWIEEQSRAGPSTVPDNTTIKLAATGLESLFRLRQIARKILRQLPIKMTALTLALSVYY